MKTKHLRLMQRVYIILFFCFMYLPIAYMIVFSFNQSKGLFALHRLYPQVVPQPVHECVHPPCAVGVR